MTTKIIFKIAILFFMTSLSHSSPNLTPDEICVCNNNTSMSPLNSRVEGTKDFLNAEKHGTAKTSAERSTYPICCQDYKNISETSTPQCSPFCENGNCEEPNTCKCHYCWGGKSCNETLFCIISQSISLNVSEERSEDSTIQNTESTTSNSSITSKGLPTCRMECLGIEVNGTQVGDMINYYIPIDSPCNTESFYWILLKRYKYDMIGIAIGIILLIVIVIYAVCRVARRKRRREDTKDNISMVTRYPNYMEENSIYS